MLLSRKILNHLNSMSIHKFSLNTLTNFKFASAHENNLNQFDDDDDVENNPDVVQQCEVSGRTGHMLLLYLIIWLQQYGIVQDGLIGLHFIFIYTQLSLQYENKYVAILPLYKLYALTGILQSIFVNICDRPIINFKNTIVCLTLLVLHFIFTFMIDKIRKILDDPLELALVTSGVGLLAFYVLYARPYIFTNKTKVNKHSLNMTLKQLTEEAKGDKNFCKIVITESSALSNQFKAKIITRLKEFLQQQQLPALVNCAPLKLFHAGSETFTNTLSYDDAEDEKDFMSYYQNALKCQLTVERTIMDIQKIKNSNKTTYLICDTNSLDLKVRYDLVLWEKFLAQNKIKQQSLTSNYQIVFHILNSSMFDLPKEWTSKITDYSHYAKDSNERIYQTWRKTPHYYAIEYDYRLIMEQNVQHAVQYIIKCLKPFLAKQVYYKKRQVLVKDW